MTTTVYIAASRERLREIAYQLALVADRAADVDLRIPVELSGVSATSGAEVAFSNDDMEDRDDLPAGTVLVEVER
jgi:hypothetical protein